ncbi:MAG: hypothetical protein JW821_19255 [Deltaproteobacteria bacterium]|nr:hypothetical protein [Deltaproteobacteria bacterium]
MRSYVIDEISPQDMESLRVFLKENALPSDLEEIFWVRVPEDILSDVQFQHRDCRPHVFAVELGGDWMKLEFFIRTLSGMRCTCQSYCTPQQRDFIVRFADSAVTALGIRT